MGCRRQSAFTLVELLAVVAVIAVLAAFLFPVFAQAREKARQSACLSNLNGKTPWAPGKEMTRPDQLQ
jgi:prepilin-type N-terminal cleavage/methylation domain-containing protein